MLAKSRKVINWRPGLDSCWMRVEQDRRPDSEMMRPDQPLDEAVKQLLLSLLTLHGDLYKE